MMLPGGTTLRPPVSLTHAHYEKEMSSANNELVTYLHDGEVTVSNPSADDIAAAVGYLRNDTGYLVDLTLAGGKPILQIVAEDGPEGLGLAAIPGDGGAGHYSTSAELSDAEIVSTCMVFIATGSVSHAPIQFTPEASSTWGRVHEQVVPDARERRRNDPQNVVSYWMETGGYWDHERLHAALEQGATFEAFTLLPPLVYLAKTHGASERAIGPLLVLGFDLASLHEGHTALWHAIEQFNFRFASGLVRHGASLEDARSSRKFDDWQRADQRQSLLRTIKTGNLPALRAWLAGRTSGEVTYELVQEAMRHDQMAVFELLLAHKGRVRFKTVEFGPWAQAMALPNTRYLETLMRYGAYKYVCVLDGQGGREFIGASVECLRYLQKRGTTAGFERGFRAIVTHLMPRHAQVLPLFPDDYFYGLEPSVVVRLINLLETSDPARIDRLLERTDFAKVVKEVFSMPGTGRSLTLVPRIFGHVVEFPGWDAVYHLHMQRYVDGVGTELVAIARSIAFD